MSAQSDVSQTAQIVDIVSLLDTPGRKRIATAADLRESATLLSIRQNLRYQACIGVDDIDKFTDHYPALFVDRIFSRVRKLLNTEFGQLRVHRYRQAFAVGHYCVEGLIGGLLRVQYHARHIDLPVPGACGELPDVRGVTLTWGVGDTVTVADNERLRRRRLKR
jgi:hypothetical protein